MAPASSAKSVYSLDSTGWRRFQKGCTIRKLLSRLLCRYGNAHGGHLVEGTKVLLTVDVIIAEIEGMVMGRQFDENLEVPIFAPRQV